MPPKVRELMAELERAGFVNRGGKGSHRNFVHPKVARPVTIYGGCHGVNEREVFDELCRLVEEAIALYKVDGKALPPPTSGRDFANKMQHVA